MKRSQFYVLVGFLLSIKADVCYGKWQVAANVGAALFCFTLGICYSFLDKEGR